MTAVERCDFGDLPVETCGCHRCRPDVTDAMLDGSLDVIPGAGVQLDQPGFEPVSRRFEAAFRGECHACGTDIRPGSMIARTTEGYVCAGCAA